MMVLIRLPEYGFVDFCRFFRLYLEETAKSINFAVRFAISGKTKAAYEYCRL